MNLSQCMNFINSFDKNGKAVNDLSRAKSLIASVGNPHENLKFIHIAGTNGKGSVAQMINEMCILEGKKTGMFTSPYIFKYTDRIKINNENIPDDRLRIACQKVIEVVERTQKHSYSQFEITMAIALLYFSDEKCDVVVWETGLGGLLDCTNIVTPQVSVITSIDYDHTAILGSTLSEIATQKAGIIKENIPCVISAGNADETMNIVKKTALNKNSELTIADETKLEVLSSNIFGSEFIYKNEKYKVSMCGSHQIINCATAIEAAKMIGISLGNIKLGATKAQVPARTQIVSKNPLIIVDGSHNPAGTKALAETLKNITQPITAVIGMLEEKQVSLAVENLLPVISEFVCVDGFNPNEISAINLCKMIEDLGGQAKAFSTFEKSLDHAVSKKGAVVVCGSLYLASKYLNIFFNN